MLSRILQKMPPSVLVKPMIFLGKRLLVNNQGVRNLKDDLLFVISEKRIGFISPGGDGKLRFTSVQPLFAAYEHPNASVPVSLDDMDGFGIGSEARVKCSRPAVSATP